MREFLLAPVWGALGFLAFFLCAVIGLAYAALALAAGLCMGLALLCFGFWLLTQHPASLDATFGFLLWGVVPAALMALIGHAAGRAAGLREPRRHRAG
ncbi:hypothetical protein [Siccirubricoccus sp. G192]|uniref:hypothetical protein n=1 Tax=Siccirubricoccus sp. G192 TaxID=2849651 RepID=UPI001C2C1AD7|nr:hypothetical protein [Siccirubricoccus sp. G192]MBV1800470.1 hypothetical protein [Siccirubricoccus sp. G192]